jgi:hypothetical protein
MVTCKQLGHGPLYSYKLLATPHLIHHQQRQQIQQHNQKQPANPISPSITHSLLSTLHVLIHLLCSSERFSDVCLFVLFPSFEMAPMVDDSLQETSADLSVSIQHPSPLYLMITYFPHKGFRGAETKHHATPDGGNASSTGAMYYHQSLRASSPPPPI